MACSNGPATSTVEFFDKNDTLTHVGATLESGRTEYAMPWYELDH